jgi:hypothetical protein
VSYDIYIGQAVLFSEWPKDGDGEEPRAEWQVDGMTHPEAPNKPDMTGQGNGCHPGYGQWAEAMREVGLYDLWFKEYEGFLSPHPGIKRLTRAHLGAVQIARATYKAAHPNERPGCCECAECQKFERKPDPPPHDPTLNFNMLRLDWMEFWMRWTLENCKRPAVYNR